MPTFGNVRYAPGCPGFVRHTSFREPTSPLLLKAERGEFQGVCVLGYRAHHLFRRAVRNIRLDLQGDGHAGSHQGLEVLDDFVGDGFDLQRCFQRIQLYGAEETAIDLFARWNRRFSAAFPWGVVPIGF